MWSVISRRRTAALGRYNAVRPGQLNNAVLRALLADGSAWRIVDAEPVRRRRRHADVAGAVAAAFGPEVS